MGGGWPNLEVNGKQFGPIRRLATLTFLIVYGAVDWCVPWNSHHGLWIHLLGHLASQGIGCMVDVHKTNVPGYIIRKKIWRIWGPGNRTQVPTPAWQCTNHQANCVSLLIKWNRNNIREKYAYGISRAKISNEPVIQGHVHLLLRLPEFTK